MIYVAFWPGRVVLRRVQLVALVAAVAVVALLPLYGDPRNSAVTHSEWARMLLRGLDMHAAMEQTTTAAQAFAVLSWKGSLSYRADRYVTGDDVRVEGEGEGRQVIATGEIGEVTYAVAVVRGGDYRVRLRMAAAPGRPSVSAELAEVGEVKPVDAFTVVPTAAMTWVDAGASHLDPGAYTASVLLPRGTTLRHIEVAPPCLVPIEPPGGWKATAVLLSEHAAVTMVQALDREYELPPAEVPVEVGAAQFQTEASAFPAGGSAGFEQSIKGGTSGTRAVVFVEIPEAGLYTLSAFGLRGAGQSWTADACLKAVVCADRDARSDITEWRPVLTAQFAAGRHAFSVLLAPGAVIQRVRVEKKKETPADYVATLRRLGFDVGPAGPMPRNLAVDAMRFLEKAAAPMKEARCGDVVLPGQVAGTRAGLEVAQIPGPAQPGPNAGTGPPPFGVPLVPLPGPLDEPSPEPSPSVPVTPSEPPSPAPTPAPSEVPSPPPPPPSPLPSADDSTPVQPLPSPSPSP